MAPKDDGLGIPEDALNHLIQSFKDISDTFKDILKAQQQRTADLEKGEPVGSGHKK
jgi:hypothetical protein